jgi:hypothetical protein
MSERRRLIAFVVARGAAMVALMAALLAVVGLDPPHVGTKVYFSPPPFPFDWTWSHRALFGALLGACAAPLALLEGKVARGSRSVPAAVATGLASIPLAVALFTLARLEVTYLASLNYGFGFSRSAVATFEAARVLLTTDPRWLFDMVPLAISFGIVPFVRLCPRPTRAWLIALLPAHAAAIVSGLIIAACFGWEDDSGWYVPASASFLVLLLAPWTAWCVDRALAPGAPAENLPPHLPAKDGRDAYLAANGFTVAGYTAPTFTLKILGIPRTFENPPSRQRVVPLHDLHHVITGYGTDYTGEAEIGVWELRAGCTTGILYFLNGMAALIGLAIAPLRTLRAWRRARGCHSLYTLDVPYDALLALTVGELRARTGVPAEGQADRAAALHSDAPSARVRWPLDARDEPSTPATSTPSGDRPSET